MHKLFLKMLVFFYYFFLIKSIVSYIKFPFSRNISQELSPKYFVYNELIINLSLGIPKQNIKAIIDFEHKGLYIPNTFVNGHYNENKSSSYIIDSTNPKSTKKSFVYNGYNFYLKNSLENIYFNYNEKEISYNNFSFFLITSDDSNQKLEEAIIGLQITTYQDRFNTLSQLKEKNIISCNFINEDSGEIIIGNYPHDYYNDLQSSSLKLHRAEISYSYWFMDFTNITYGKKSDTILRVIFPFNIKGIIGNKFYYEYINQTFFHNLVIKGKCTEEKFRNKLNRFSELVMYYCDKDIDITKFENLEFYSKPMNYTFVLDYNDLFKIYNNKYVFQVIFDSSYAEKWRLGEVFQKKYRVFLDMDSNLFGFYTKKIKNKSSSTFYFIILILFLVIIIIILSALLYKNIIGYKNRKIRANELEENYEYIESFNNKIN